MSIIYLQTVFLIPTIVPTNLGTMSSTPNNPNYLFPSRKGVKTSIAVVVLGFKSVLIEKFIHKLIS